MPAAGDPPTLADFRQAFADAIRGGRSSVADTHTGSGYDYAGGAAAIVWSRQAQRDRRLFRAGYTETADGTDLARLVEAKYNVIRIPAAYGTGLLTLGRPNIAGGGGTIYAGTRVEVLTSTSPRVYAVAADTALAASAILAPIPIRATRTGTGVAVLAGADALRLTDEVFDATLVPYALTCGDGTDEEDAGAYVARARKAKKDARAGYETLLITTCEDAGADEVVLLDASSLGPALDFGISNLYVGDSGFTSPPALLDAVAIAVDAARVAGADLQILGMVPTPVSCSVVASLWDDPGGFDQVDLKAGIVAALLEEFSHRTRWWTFRQYALEGAAQASNNAIQTVTVTTSPMEPAVAFPAVLPRYTLAPNAISVQLTGPT